MSTKTHQLVEALVKEDLFSAKKLINEALFDRMSSQLEEKLINFAPTVFNESSKLSPKQKKIASLAGDPNKIDKEDFKALRKEDVDHLEEQFQEELKSLVEEIEEETGTELTEEEIMELAQDLADLIAEEQGDSDNDSVPDEEDEDDSDTNDDYVHDKTGARLRGHPGTMNAGSEAY